MSQPLVTVACPVYRHQPFVRQCLNAVAAQTIGANTIQLIIIDDHSPDSSLEVVRLWMREGSVPDTTLITHQTNRGLWFGLQEAYQAAKGKYFCISSGDDLMHPHMIKTLTDALESPGPEAACAYADHDYVDAQGHITGTSMLRQIYQSIDDIPQGHILAKAIWQAPFVTQAAMFRTASMHAIGHRYRPEIICEDWDLILQLAAHGHRFLHVNSVVASYRTDPQMPSMLRSYNHRSHRNRMHASIMRMMLNAMHIPEVPETERTQMAAKCLHAATQTIWNPGQQPVIRQQLAELTRLRPSLAPHILRVILLLRINKITATISYISESLQAFRHTIPVLSVRIREKLIISLTRKH